MEGCGGRHACLSGLTAFGLGQHLLRRWGRQHCELEELLSLAKEETSRPSTFKSSLFFLFFKINHSHSKMYNMYMLRFSIRMDGCLYADVYFSTQ